MKNIANVMENPEVKDFFKKYFKDWTDVKSMVMLMKVYEKLDENFDDLNGYQKLALLYEIIGDSKSRQHVCESMTNWVDKTSCVCSREKNLLDNQPDL